MLVGAWFLGLLAGVQGAGAEAEAVRLRVAGGPDWVWVHQPLRVELELELAPEADLLPLTNRALDLPIVLGGAWFELPEGLRELATEPLEGPLVGLGREPGPIEPVAGSEGRRFTAGAWLVPEVVGDLALPTATARFAVAGRFELDWLGELRPVGREERFATAALPVIEVRPWPSGDRPEGFWGAVGEFELELHVTPRDLRVGEELRVAYRLVGRGGVGGAPPERLDLPGFTQTARLLTLAAATQDRVALELDFALRAEAAGAIDLHLPAWAWLAPSEERFVEGANGLVPIVVREVARADPAPARDPRHEPAADAVDAQGESVDEDWDGPEVHLWEELLEERWSLQFLVFGVLPLVVLALLATLAGLILRDMSRRIARPSRTHRHSVLASATADECLASVRAGDLATATDRLRLLLAAVVDGHPPAFVGADARRELNRLGLAPATTDALARAYDELSSASYRGGSPAVDAENLEAALRTLLGSELLDWQAIEQRLADR